MGISTITKIATGDALTVLAKIPTKAANSCVTSPAYWSLRDYEVEGQMGPEPSPQEYINRLVRVFDEIFRVLRDDGNCWVVLGDTYYGSRKSRLPWSEEGESPISAETNGGRRAG